MRARSSLLGLALAVFALVACGQKKELASRQIATLTPTPAVATPTLLPGLPTSTPWSGTVAPSSTPTATIEPTATPTPTATPLPGERLALGQSLQEVEDFAGAVEQYQAGLLSNELSDAERQAALLGLGQASLAAGQYAVADEAFGMLLADAAHSAGALGVEGQGGNQVDAAEVYFLQAKSYEEQGECRPAIGAYQTYLRHDDTLAAYVQARIAECYLAIEEPDQAIAAYELAVAADAFLPVTVANRNRLAGLYQEAGDFQRAIEQYDLVLETAADEDTLGRALYLAGTAELLAGDTEAAYQRYQEGVEQYPNAYESYLGLMALIDAGYQVDALQRGIVDYNANAFEAAVAVLSQYVETTDPHDEEAHLYLAWSLEGLGNTPAGLEQIQVYIDSQAPAESNQETPADSDQATPGGNSPATPAGVGKSSPAATATAAPVTVEEPPPREIKALARGTLEKAKMLARDGQLGQAADVYAEYVTRFGDEADAPFAAWWSAALAERTGDYQEAIARYKLLAELYPVHDDADEALFRAGYVAYQSGDQETAQQLWEEALSRYPAGEYGAAALLWLIRTAGEDEREQWLARAGEVHGSTYYPLRVRHIVSETAPFEAPESLNLVLSDQDRVEAENWLREQLSLPPETKVTPLSGALAEDGRLRRGAALWRLGELDEARQELESLRKEYAPDPLASYQLAVYFRELGLYRSSILAAMAVIKELEVDVLDAPRFIAGLAYPTYYAGLITAEADRYGYDPLIQFALVRQESLFESSATSGAAAQGLSQVIPDTGAYIAQRLGWRDYVNEDLYRPYVGIAFGAFYLDQQLDAFDGDVAAALSAYNGGPGNAARWYQEAGGDIDNYVDTIDFSETRMYVERIYSAHAIYRQLYGEKPS
jgi:soluble lytic murein transglycosylase